MSGTLPSAGVLTSKEIEGLKLIKNPRSDRLRPTSYDLSLGAEYQDNEGKISSLGDGQTLKIPEYGVVLVSTEEVVRTNDRTAGRFDLKIRHALRGLILQVGTQVEPQYEGPLFGLVMNLSSRPVTLIRGEDIFTIEFHTLTSAVDGQVKVISSLSEFLVRQRVTEAVESSLSGIKSHLVGQLKAQVEESVKNQHALWEQEKMNKTAVFTAIFAAIAVLILSIALPIVINKLTIDRDDMLFQQLRISKLSQMLDNEPSSRALFDALRKNPDGLERLIEQLNAQRSDQLTGPQSNPAGGRVASGQGAKADVKKDGNGPGR